MERDASMLPRPRRIPTMLSRPRRIPPSSRSEKAEAIGSYTNRRRSRRPREGQGRSSSSRRSGFGVPSRASLLGDGVEAELGPLLGGVLLRLVRLLGLVRGRGDPGGELDVCAGEGAGGA